MHSFYDFTRRQVLCQVPWAPEEPPQVTRPFDLSFLLQIQTFFSLCKSYCRPKMTTGEHRHTTQLRRHRLAVGAAPPGASYACGSLMLVKWMPGWRCFCSNCNVPFYGVCRVENGIYVVAAAKLVYIRFYAALWPRFSVLCVAVAFPFVLNALFCSPLSGVTSRVSSRPF